MKRRHQRRAQVRAKDPRDFAGCRALDQLLPPTTQFLELRANSLETIRRDPLDALESSLRRELQRNRQPYEIDQRDIGEKLLLVKCELAEVPLRRVVWVGDVLHGGLDECGPWVEEEDEFFWIAEPDTAADHWGDLDGALGTGIDGYIDGFLDGSESVGRRLGGRW
jgi:hypothetical protein